MANSPCPTPKARPADRRWIAAKRQERPVWTALFSDLYNFPGKAVEIMAFMRVAAREIIFYFQEKVIVRQYG